jgi:topoisomerase-4 subunit A
MTDQINPKDFGAENIQETPFADALSERYLAYALSTIMSRSLPDVRDGLKPVHRRLIYAMRLLKLDPDKGYKKCARVVGDVIGKYHPHGDQSVYDALVRLAQVFSVRYPLIDGQGNFGNIDGDNAAAMRYTEARMTKVASLLMEGLDEECVDFRETYDGEEREPIVLPAGFPNLLANGSNGIAVGMATSVPPHNVAELCDGLMAIVDLHLGKRQSLTTTQLINRIPGPDFPTGGIIVESHASILQSYETGRGSFRLRARWEREELGRGGYQIVVTEIPFQVQKSKLIEKIAELINAKRLPILADVRDESAEEIRIVFEPKNRTIEDVVLMESLFKLTELEVRISLNLNVLDKNQVPRVMSMREALEEYLDHRKVVLVKRTEFRLGKIDHRMEVLGGYLVAFLNLDEVISIIREEDEPKPVLMSRFSLSDVQAEAILNMRLRSLRKLEEMELRREHDTLGLERESLRTLLNDDNLQWENISGQLAALKKEFSPKTELGARRSSFDDAPDVVEMPMEAMIEKEAITVICSKMGWVRALRGHLAADEEVKFKEGDEAKYRFHAHTTDKLLVFASNGKFFTIGADKLPGGRGNGEPIRLMFDMGNKEEIIAFFPYVKDQKQLVASSVGKGFLVETNNLLASTRGGKQVMNVSGVAKAMICIAVEGGHVAVVGQNRKLLIYSIEELPLMNKGQGVTLQKYKDGGLSDLITFKLENGLTWTMGGEEARQRTETELEMWMGKRAGAGRMAPRGFPQRGTFHI